MIQKLFATFFKKGYAHVFYALLIEAILLLLLSFGALFTFETILPGLISDRFIIGKLVIIAVLLVFFAAFLGRKLHIVFPVTVSRPLRIFFIASALWAVAILTISLLNFPLWSIPIFLIAFGAIGYLSWKEFSLKRD